MSTLTLSDDDDEVEDTVGHVPRGFGVSLRC